MFSRTVSVVAAVAASPSRPTSWTNTWKTSTSRNTCAPAGPPYLSKRPNSSRSSRQPERVLNSRRYPCERKSTRPTRADAHDPATVAQARTRDSQLGKAGPAEDQHQSQRDVERGSGGLDAQHGPRLPTAGEKPVDGGHDHHRQRRKTKAAQVSHLEDLQRARVPAHRDQLRGCRDHQQKQEPGDHGEVDSLPDRRPDPLRPAGAGVLRNERRDVPGRYLQEPERQPVPHDGRERGGHLSLVVPGKQDRIDKDLDGHEALADDQRQGQREELPATPGAHWIAGARNGSLRRRVVRLP